MEKSIAHKFKNKYVITGIILVVLILVLTGVASYAYFASSANTVLDGVCVGGIDLSGKTEAEACEELKEQISVPADAIKFVCKDTAFEISPGRISLEADIESSVKEAFIHGREGNPFKRISSFYGTTFFGVDLPVLFKCDEAALMGAIEENLPDMIIPVTPYSVEVGENCIIVTNGLGGTKISQENISSLIYEKIKTNTLSEPIYLTIEDAPAQDIDFEEFVSVYLREAVDADYSEENGNYVFTKEVEGISFDTEIARGIIEENRENKNPYKIPATITFPKVTVEDLQIKFASAEISSYSTSYASSDANRASNVALAAAKINGVVLNPGERFSFNGVVGPRTAATGFKVAHVYEGDKVVDGMGGGICQVSSTLYNAVLLADLKIVYRLNHSMPVAYVPLGRDATVSYGTIDFVFENNKNHPIKVCAVTHNRQLTISINGTDADKVNISLVTENAGYTPYSTKEVEDPTLKEGEKTVVKNGANGSIVKLYKVYTKNDGSKETVFVSRSSYLPTTKVVNVGPKAQAPKNDIQNEQVPVIGDNTEQTKAPENTQNTGNEKNPVSENEGVSSSDENSDTSETAPSDIEDAQQSFAPTEGDAETQTPLKNEQEAEDFSDAAKETSEV